METTTQKHEWIITEDGRKFDLVKARDLDYSTGYIHGVKTTGVYLTRSGRVIVGTDSSWDDGTHRGWRTGQKYHVASEHEIAQLADHIPALLDLVPESD